MRVLWSWTMHRLHAWFCLAHVVVLPLNRTYPAMPTDSAWEVRLATSSELLNAAADMPEQLTADFVEAALERGDICAAAFTHERLVGFMWSSFVGAPVEDGLWAEVKPPYTYGYKSYVLPAYRGERILTRLAEVRDQAGLERGFDYNVAYIETHNYASYRSALHAGIAESGFIGYVRGFGRCYPFVTKKARATTLRFVNREVQLADKS